MDRPRLASWAAARWHEGFVLLLDLRDGRTARIGPREWAVLRQMDGSRDLEGVRIAAARAGARAGAQQVGAFVSELGRLGLLATETPVSPELSFARDLPIEALEGYHLRCDGTGGCCRLFHTVIFSPLEAARARAHLPLVAGAGDDPNAGFLPERGLEPGALAGPMAEGGCGYLVGDRCGLHEVGKPIGCRTFPDRYVDDGHRIRVGPRIECRCEIDSLLRPESSLATYPDRGRELPREVFVHRLPDTILRGAEVMKRDRYLEWGAELVPSGDPARWLWSLAPQDSEPEAALASWEQRIAHRLEQQAWRSPANLVRRSLGWLASACRTARTLPRARQPEIEALVWRAAHHLHELAIEGDVGRGARRLAVQLWLARSFPDADDLAAAHPIALVRALSRGYGLP